MNPNQIIQNAVEEIRKVVIDSKANNRDVIARYTAAIAVNFTDWIGKTIPWVRHETAHHVLVDNLRCESVDDHVSMLLSFASSSGAMPEGGDYNYVYDEVTDVRKLFSEPATSGLSGVALCAVLENSSLVFIPDLARRARLTGCTDLTYTNVHGEADIDHSRAFLKAVEREVMMGYRNPEYFISDACDQAVKLIACIYS